MGNGKNMCKEFACLAVFLLSFVHKVSAGHALRQDTFGHHIPRREGDPPLLGEFTTNTIDIRSTKQTQLREREVETILRSHNSALFMNFEGIQAPEPERLMVRTYDEAVALVAQNTAIFFKSEHDHDSALLTASVALSACATDITDRLKLILAGNKTLYENAPYAHGRRQEYCIIEGWGDHMLVRHYSLWEEYRKPLKVKAHSKEEADSIMKERWEGLHESVKADMNSDDFTTPIRRYLLQYTTDDINLTSGYRAGFLFNIDYKIDLTTMTELPPAYHPDLS